MEIFSFIAFLPGVYMLSFFLIIGKILIGKKQTYSAKFQIIYIMGLLLGVLHSIYFWMYGIAGLLKGSIAIEALLVFSLMFPAVILSKYYPRVSGLIISLVALDAPFLINKISSSDSFSKFFF